MLLENEQIDIILLNEADTNPITSDKDCIIQGYKTILQKTKSIKGLKRNQKGKPGSVGCCGLVDLFVMYVPYDDHFLMRCFVFEDSYYVGGATC